MLHSSLAMLPSAMTVGISSLSPSINFPLVLQTPSTCCSTQSPATPIILVQSPQTAVQPSKVTSVSFNTAPPNLSLLAPQLENIHSSVPATSSIFSPSKHSLPYLNSENFLLTSPCSSSLLSKGDSQHDHLQRNLEHRPGIDFGNGWKVVGMTSVLGIPSAGAVIPNLESLCPPPSTTQSSVFTSPVPANSAKLLTLPNSTQQPLLSLSSKPVPLPTVAHTIQFPSQTDTSHFSDLPDIDSRHEPSDPSEHWKIIGLTSLSHGLNGAIQDSTVATLSLPSLILPESVLKPSLPTSSRTEIVQSEKRGPYFSTSSNSDFQNLSGNQCDTACQWKIAGITTLPISPTLNAHSGKLLNNTLPLHTENSCGKFSLCSNSAANPEWMVVGVASLGNENSPAVTPSLIPNQTAQVFTLTSGAPMLTGPPPPVITSDGCWKVVGVVPLPKDVSDLPSCNKDGMLPPPASVDINTLRSDRQAEVITAVSQSSNSCETSSEKPKQEFSLGEDSRDFYHETILKKNTVSSMLKMKRYYDKRGHAGIKDRLSTYIKIKLNSSPTRSKGISLRDTKKEKDPTWDPFEAEDRALLSRVYRSQVGSQRSCLKQHNGSDQKDVIPTVRQLNSSGLVKHDDQTQCADNWCVFKEEGGEMVLSNSDLVTDVVPLSAIDPWGVCTEEDLEHASEMISDKGDNKFLYSSSRKRKLTTPRKMVQ